MQFEIKITGEAQELAALMQIIAATTQTATAQTEPEYKTEAPKRKPAIKQTATEPEAPKTTATTQTEPEYKTEAAKDLEDRSVKEYLKSKITLQDIRALMSKVIVNNREAVVADLKACGATGGISTLAPEKYTEFYNKIKQYEQQ